MAKKTVKEENWLLQKENGLCGLPVAKEKKIHTFCEGYKSFLNAAKTERECVREAVKLAEKAGFVPFQPAGVEIALACHKKKHRRGIVLQSFQKLKKRLFFLFPKL